MNVTLIGMPGSGKSFTGEKLAGILDFSFVDPDKDLEQAHKMSLQEVLEKLGEGVFLRAEADLSIAAVENADSTVLATGGSIIYSDYAMEELARLSTIVYLKVSLEVLKERVGDAPRGIVGLKKRTLAQLYRERSSLYEKWANITVDAAQAENEIIEEIKTALRF